MEFYHRPVLLEPCLTGLAIRPDGIYVDGTTGGAGHSRAIASRLTTGKLISLDKDPDAIATARERLAAFGERSVVVQSDFSEIDAVMQQLGIREVDGVLLDLGVSSHQLDTPERGFSYHSEARLDMRMSQSGLSAYDIVNSWSAEELTRILREYGEEKFARQIALGIVKERNSTPISTTVELAELVKRYIPAKYRREGGHPARKTFQAIRIAVNAELDVLSIALDKAFDALKIGGRIAVITFHSLEDRMVKQRFASLCKGCDCPPDFPVCVCGKKPRAKLVNRKPIEADAQELAENPRSRSAKLRIIEKIM